MDDQITLNLEDEIVRVEEKLKNFTPGTKEYYEVAKALELLYQMRLSGLKVELDYDEKREKRITENGRADEELRLREHEFILRQEENEDKRKQRDAENRRAEEDIRLRDREAALHKEQFDDQKKDRWIKLGIAGAELMVPMIFYGIWMARGFKFETSGTYTSNTFKGLWNRFRPFKK